MHKSIFVHFFNEAKHQVVSADICSIFSKNLSVLSLIAFYFSESLHRLAEFFRSMADWFFFVVKFCSLQLSRSFVANRLLRKFFAISAERISPEASFFITQANIMFSFIFTGNFTRSSRFFQLAENFSFFWKRSQTADERAGEDGGNVKCFFWHFFDVKKHEIFFDC